MERFLIRQPKKPRTDDLQGAPVGSCSRTDVSEAVTGIQATDASTSGSSSVAQPCLVSTRPPSVIVSWNCNSLRLRAEKMGGLEKAVKAFLSEGAEAIVLQETRIKPEDKGPCEAALKSAGLKDWCFYWGMHAGNKRYSGTAFLVKREFRPLNVVFSISHLVSDVSAVYRQRGVQGWEDPDREGRIVLAEYPQCWLLGVYTPNCTWFEHGRIRREDWDARFTNAVQVLQTGRQGVANGPQTTSTQQQGSSGPKHNYFFQPVQRQPSLKNVAIEGKPVIVAGDLNVCHTPLDVSHPDFFANAKKPLNVGTKDPGLPGQPGYTEPERQRFTELLQKCCLVDTFRQSHPQQRRLTWGFSAAFENARYAGKYMGLDYFLVSQSLWDTGFLLDSKVWGQNEEACFGSDHVPVVLVLDWSKATAKATAVTQL